MPPSPSLLLVGCGRMGSALWHGWKAAGTFGSLSVVEPHPAPPVSRSLAGVVASLEDLPPDLSPDLVVFAVKPQHMADAIPPYARFARRGCTFLSIAAGKTLSFLADHLGEEAALVRAMPNTPAAIGQGISVAVGNSNVTPEGRALAHSALRAGGLVEWVDDEGMMDAVTALSGSGPAYVFLLTDCLAHAGQALGLPPALALSLARTTVAGSGALLARSADESPEALRQAVTSPGGTTAAALSVLTQEDRLQVLFTEALKAACARSRELAC